jgi:hypothetical protein
MIIPVDGRLPNCNNWRRDNKLEEISRLTNGLLIELCSSKEQLANKYALLAKNIVQRAIKRGHKAIPLNKLELANKVDLDSIKVFYGTQIIPKGMAQTGWIFDEKNNTILFGSQIHLSNQPSGTKFTIQYDHI